MAAIDILLLSDKDKESLLSEIMSALSAIKIIKNELEPKDLEDIKKIDKNYIASMSSYLANIIDDYDSLDEIEDKLTPIGVELSQSLRLYMQGLSKTIDASMKDLDSL